jgi:CRP-like cAMP-binding protein
MDQVEQLQLFRGHLERYVVFNDNEWTAVIPHISFMRLKKKDYFAEAGKVCNYVGYLASGSVRYYHVRDGEELTAYFCFADDLVSSYKSFLKREPGNTYIQALEDTLLATISFDHMQQMLQTPALANKTERVFRLIAEHYLCCYEDRIQAFITQSPEKRYLELLKTGKEIMQRIPQHYVANYLGITPVSLSRIRRRILEPAQ